MEEVLGVTDKNTAIRAAIEALEGHLRATQGFMDTDDIRAALTHLRAALEQTEWRPIAEAHEDHGVCVFVDIREPDPLCASTLDSDFEESREWYGWTHFMPVRLSNQEAERLKAAMPAPPTEAASATMKKGDEYWDEVKRTAEKVQGWPDWKKGKPND